MKENPCIFRRKVNFYETDQMGIVHHSNYIRWFEEARVHLMDEIDFGYEKAAESGVDLPVLEVSCKYKSMTRFSETVIIETNVIELTKVKMKLGYTVTDEKTKAVRATGASLHCYYSNIKKRPVSLKDALPELYEKFEELAQNARV